MASEEEDYVDIQKNSGGSGEDEDDRDPTIEELMAELEADSGMTAFDQLLEKAANRVTTPPKPDSKVMEVEKPETDTTVHTLASASKPDQKQNQLGQSEPVKPVTVQSSERPSAARQIIIPDKMEKAPPSNNFRKTDEPATSPAAREPPVQSVRSPGANAKPGATTPKRDSGGLSVIGSLWATAVASASSVKASAEEMMREQDLSLKVIYAGTSHHIVLQRSETIRKSVATFFRSNAHIDTHGFVRDETTPARLD
jgi:hypothetical protein